VSRRSSLAVAPFRFASHPDRALLLRSLFLRTFKEAMKIGSETYHHLKKVIQTKYGIDGTFSLLFPRVVDVAFLPLQPEVVLRR